MIWLISCLLLFIESFFPQRITNYNTFLFCRGKKFLEWEIVLFIYSFITFTLFMSCPYGSPTSFRGLNPNDGIKCQFPYPITKEVGPYNSTLLSWRPLTTKTSPGVWCMYRDLGPRQIKYIKYEHRRIKLC